MQKKGRKKRIKKEEGSKDLRIYSLDGKKLIFVLKPGVSLDYQELIGQKKRKLKHSDFKRSF